MIFLHDNSNAPDCLDGSDEDISELYMDQQIERRFRYEDLSCMKVTIYSPKKMEHLMYDCIDTYAFSFLNLIFSTTPDTMSDICWSALNCYFNLLNPSINFKL